MLMIVMAVEQATRRQPPCTQTTTTSNVKYSIDGVLVSRSQFQYHTQHSKSAKQASTLQRPPTQPHTATVAVYR